MMLKYDMISIFIRTIDSVWVVYSLQEVKWKLIQSYQKELKPNYNSWNTYKYLFNMKTKNKQ